MSQYLLQFFKGLLQNFAVPQYRNTYLQMSDNLVICFVFHILYCTLLYCIEIICFTLKDPHYFLLVWYGMVESELFCRYCMVEFELYGGIVWQSYCMVPLYGRQHYLNCMAGIVWQSYCMVPLYGSSIRIVWQSQNCIAGRANQRLDWRCIVVQRRTIINHRRASLLCIVMYIALYSMYCIVYCIVY